MVSSGNSVGFSMGKKVVYFSDVAKLRSFPLQSVNENKLSCFKSTRFEVSKGIVITIFIGLLFTCVQLFEYQQATFSINDGIYGSLFYLLTGFHGFHVLVGTIFLLVCLLRHLSYHFTIEHHLGFEMAIWYWHFVDIVWIFLFVFVYI